MSFKTTIIRYFFLKFKVEEIAFNRPRKISLLLLIAALEVIPKKRQKSLHFKRSVNRTASTLTVLNDRSRPHPTLLFSYLGEDVAN